MPGREDHLQASVHLMLINPEVAKRERLLSRELCFRAAMVNADVAAFAKRPSLTANQRPRRQGRLGRASGKNRRWLAPQ
jgi:hypothetical protein